MVSTHASDTDTPQVAMFAVGASARATIAATPEQIWAWVADPTRHPMLAGSGEPQAITVVGGEVEGVGTRFEAQQRLFGLSILPYVSHSEVVKYEPNRCFRFQVEGHALWEFTLEPAGIGSDGSTLVTHRHRLELPSQGPTRLFRPLVQVRTRQNASNMARTLLNLARLVGAPPPTDLQVSYDAPVLA